MGPGSPDVGTGSVLNVQAEDEVRVGCGGKTSPTV